MDKPTPFPGRAKIIPAKTADGRDPILLPYQRDWVMDRSISKLMEKGRRIGVSYGTAYERDRNHADKDCAVDSWISSRDEPTARLFVADCLKFTKILNIGAKDLGQQVLDEKGNTAYCIRFANGTQINSLASNPDVFAGKGGDVVLDEFALRQDPRGVYAIAGPTIDWGGRLAIISTHRGSANFFNTLITEIVHKGNPKGFSHHRVSLETALAQGFLYKVQTKLRPGDPRLDMDEADYFTYQKSRCADEETFLQEYMCVPGDDAGAFLPYELIDACKYRPEENWEATIAQLAACKNPLYLGGDIGRVHDLTVFWVIEKEPARSLTRKLVALRNETFDEQEHRLYELLSLPNLRRACIDNTGIGRQLVERAQKRFGDYRVEAVTFTNAVKEELAYPVRAAFEDKSLRIPDDSLVVSDLRGIRKETTSAGNIRFNGERSESGHCDRFWALALALHAAKTATGGAISDVSTIRTGGNISASNRPHFTPTRLASPGAGFTAPRTTRA